MRLPVLSKPTFKENPWGRSYASRDTLWVNTSMLMVKLRVYPLHAVPSGSPRQRLTQRLPPKLESLLAKMRVYPRHTVPSGSCLTQIEYQRGSTHQQSLASWRAFHVLRRV